MTRLLSLIIFAMTITRTSGVLYNKLIDGQFFDGEATLGRTCAADSDCSTVLHAECRSGVCTCANDHFARTPHADICEPGGSFGDACSSTQPCRSAFHCVGGHCACPNGFVNHDNTCIKKCSKGEIAVAEWNYKCVKLRELGEECAYDEQCHTHFAECVGGRCTCRIGTTNLKDQACVAVPHCPLGPAPLLNDSVIACSTESADSCPDGHHCQIYQYGRTAGFCCPVSATRCPIGVPHQYADCSNCPYDTHSCYTFSVGSKQHSLCCPNECHRSAPIRHQGKCLPIVPHGGECHADEQCTTLLPGSKCLDGVCACARGMFVKEGRCTPRSSWNGECMQDDDCREASQLRCVNARCKCAPEHIPEPWSDEPQQCIPAATCPTASGLFKKISTFSECNDVVKCADNEFCRKWWQDESSNRSYSLCCPKPGVHDFTTVCGRFGMSLVLTNSIDALANPLPCGLSPIEGQSECPEGSACVFNPYSEGEGICCRATIHGRT